MTSQFSDGKIPGMEAMNDTLSFVKNFWGGMQMPGMVTPTVSIEELDKKIKDLKAVESWLNVNMNMLRGTIQALEVQRATVAALQSMGDSFAENLAKHQANNTAATVSENSAPSAPASHATSPSWPMPAPDIAASAEPEPEELEEDETPDAPQPVVTAAAPENTQPQEPVKNNAASEDKSQFTNPAAWWNLLQDQFKHAVSQAVQGDELAKATAAFTPAKAASTPTTKVVKKAVKKVAAKAPANVKRKAPSPLSKTSKPTSSANPKAKSNVTIKAPAKSSTPTKAAVKKSTSTTKKS